MVSMTQVPSITRRVRPSLSCFVAHPFGLTLGAVGDDRMHRSVLQVVLAQAERDHPPGMIVAMGFRWGDDLRVRQLRMEAD